jgi:hypothetical protein
MNIEEEAYNIIKMHKDGIFQSFVKKELEIDSKKCSRIMRRLMDKDLIVREVAVSNGSRTFLVKAKEEVKEKYDLLLTGELFSPCVGCKLDCEPEYCGRLSEWIGNIMVEEVESSQEVKENKEDSLTHIISEPLAL